MSHTDISGLVRDLVLWVGRQPRSYAETMEAWRTSCPRLTVWEEALERGLVSCSSRPDGELGVEVTERGRQLYSPP
jgi:hypothetical protein